MNDFEHYLAELADHEDEKSRTELDVRRRILVAAGIRLNWIGDAVANPDLGYKLTDTTITSILFTSTSPAWNNILIDQCERSVEKFRALLAKQPELLDQFQQEATFTDEPILLRGPDDTGFYRVVDGMHRFVGAVLEERATIAAFVPVNEPAQLPICEAHVVYDLIRGFIRNAHDAQGLLELEHALRLLARTYANVAPLLKERFNATYVADDDVQAVIRRVLVKETAGTQGDQL